MYPNLNCTGFGAQDVYTRLTQRGISLTQLSGITGDIIKRKVVAQVKLNKKVIVGTNITPPRGAEVSHITLAVAYDNKSQAIIFNDPLFGASKKLEADGYTIKWLTALAYLVN